MTDIQLQIQSSDPSTATNPPVGRFSIRDTNWSSTNARFGPCLKIGIEASALSNTGLSDNTSNLTYTWLHIKVSCRTNQNIQRPIIGQIDIESLANLSIKPGGLSWGNLHWYLLPKDVELIEQVKQDKTPLYFSINVSGIAKITDGVGKWAGDIVALQGECQLQIEQSQWERWIGQLGYSVPPSQAALASTSTLTHHSWTKAAKTLEKARTHYRSGEGHDALEECLGVLEAIATAPYDRKSWEPLLSALPSQKSDALAELLSGVATYCNKVGHHRSKSDRDASNELEVMPLDHWEVDLILGATQFVLTYALRLQAAGILAIPQDGPSGSDPQ